MTIQWIPADQVGKILSRRPRVVREKLAKLPDFPKPMRPGGTGHPLWRRDEIERWAENQRADEAAANLLSDEPYSHSEMMEFVTRLGSDRSEAGVYFVFDGNELAYIGQSKNVDARLGRHPARQILSVYVLPIENYDERTAVEKRLIRLLDPRLNKLHKDQCSLPPPSSTY